MSKYIDADAFIADKRKLYCEDCYMRKNSKGKLCYEIGSAPCKSCGTNDILDDVEDYPTADVEEVVRCRSCKYKRVVDMCMVCSVSKLTTLPDGYCWRGEKE